MGFWRAALLVLVTAIAVVYIPKLFTEKLPVIVNGTTEPGFEEVLNNMRENFESGVELPYSGSAFSAYYKGKKVVDIWGGYADAEAMAPWREDTMVVVFSATKGMAAVCMAMLVDRGHLDYNKKVSHYWPEFAQNGKENVTVSMLLSHEAGVAVTDITLSLSLIQNYNELGRVLARSPPLWEPGTAHGYHAMTWGLYASQLLTRADPKKRTMGQFFRDEVAEPFGIEFHIGLPLELNYRVGRFASGAKSLVLMILTGLLDPMLRAMTWEMITGDIIIAAVMDNAGDLVSNWDTLNDPDVRATENPSQGGIGTAEAFAKVYGILANGGKDAEGKVLLSEERIKELSTGGKTRKDKCNGLQVRYNKGMRFCGENQEFFGHPGAGGNMGSALMERNIGVGYVTRYQTIYAFGNDPRFLTLHNTLMKCIDKLEEK